MELIPTKNHRKGRGCAERTFKNHGCRHAHAGADLVVDHTHQSLQVAAALGGAQIRNQLLLLGDGEEARRDL